MQFFLEVDNLSEVRIAYETGVVTGVLIRPKSIAKGGRELDQLLRELVEFPGLQVHVQVGSLDARGIMEEAKQLCALSGNMVVKVPMTMEGLKATHEFTRCGMKTCVSLVFSVSQALLAASVGATYISSYVGELDDTGQEGMQLIKDIHTALRLSGSSSKLLAADLRDSAQVGRAMLAGADIVGTPWPVFEQMVKHPLTDQGIERFLTEWGNGNSSKGG